LAAHLLATSGTLEIDGVDGSIQGIAEMDFPTGRVITTFNAAFCDGATGARACTPLALCPAGQGADSTTACLASP
jgi:hypothetical protein